MNENTAEQSSEEAYKEALRVFKDVRAHRDRLQSAIDTLTSLRDDATRATHRAANLLHDARNAYEASVS